MMELPIVVGIAQRPGPATGLPTRTAQQDLQFALRAGHGEFPRAVFAPGTVQQCVELTRHAFTMASRFQTPVLILTDQFLQDQETTVALIDREPDPVDAGIVCDPDSHYKRYQVTASGISPRAIPGGPAAVVCDSDAHDEAGHLSEDLENHLVQTKKRMRKLDGMCAEWKPPEAYGPPEAETLLLCWGSTYGPCREAVDCLNSEDSPARMLHFSQIWPMDPDAISSELEQVSRIVCVEGNQTGQFADLLREQGITDECERLLRFDGLPFTAEYIIRELEI